MIKLLNILKEIESNKILITRRSPEERQKGRLVVAQRSVQQHIKNGSQGSLGLRDTPIQSLPQGLKVGGGLYLQNTQIKSLPQDLKVDFLNLQNTPIAKKYTEEEVRQMVPDVKGTIILN